jgi:hypothetical protein
MLPLLPPTNTASGPEPILAQSGGNHFDVHHYRASAPQRIDAGSHGVRMKPHQLLEFEIRRRMNDPANNPPLSGAEVVRPCLTIDNREAPSLDTPAFRGHLAHIAHRLCSV